MKTKNLLKKLEGTHTIDAVAGMLGVDKKKAIYYIYRLRKKGYVKTRKLSDNRRLYSISFDNRLHGASYYDIINANSPVKLAATETHKIYGKQPTLEETLVYAIKTGRLRTILASLALFKKINDWGELYRLSKQNSVERHVGALYDLSRKIIRTRRMPKRFRNNSLPKQGYSFVYIIQGLKSKDFTSIEDKWKVRIPFNKSDLEDYSRPTI